MENRIVLTGRLQDMVIKLENMAEEHGGYIVLDKFRTERVYHPDTPRQSIPMLSKLPLQVELLGEATPSALGMEEDENVKYPNPEHNKPQRHIQLSNVVETEEDGIPRLYGATVLVIAKDGRRYYLDSVRFELDAFETDDQQLYETRAMLWLETLSKRYADI